MAKTRRVKDSMGELEVPADAYYGASTMRAVQNFPISGIRFPRRFIHALGLIKKAAAEVNADLGLLDRDLARAIATAAQEVADGKLDEQFPIDIYQTGSGTSTNTNANEVIAYREVVALGGTAVGTGINAHPDFAGAVCRKLAAWTGLDIKETRNHFHAQATLDALVAAHGALKTVAVSLWKIASDVRLMGSGPRAGIGELNLPEVQPGSSIMPGKVNPVIVESLTMAVARVLGNDVTVTVCGQSGSFFELNVMMPLAGYASLESISLLANSARNFATRSVAGLEATERGPEMVERGLMLGTALTPIIGYDEAAKLAKEAARSGKTIRELARERGIDEKTLAVVLDPALMTEPSAERVGGGGG